MRVFTIVTLLIGLTAGSVAAEVAIKTYQSPQEGKLNKNQQARVLREYAKLPGTTLQGSKQPFVVRKIVFPNSQVSRLIATNIKGQDMRQIGRVVNEQTDCNIKQGTLVERISSFSGSGFAFYCIP